jgi:hypothetical protein
MTENVASPRRRFQFRLRTLMIVVTLLAIPLGYIGRHFAVVRGRQAMLEGVVSRGGGYVAVGRSLPNGPPLIDRLLGDESIMVITISSSKSGESTAALAESFPEASINDVDDPVQRKLGSVLLRGRVETR